MSLRWLMVFAVVGILAAAGVLALQHRWALVNALPPSARDVVFGMRYGFRVERDVMVPMPDGVHLATNLYFPRDATGKLPTVLIRVPYNKDTHGGAIGPAHGFAGHGYVVAVQDVRGKFGSEGVFTPSYLEAEDGSATVDWIAAQPWSNGRVGTFGCSALGEAQIFLARQRNPRHAAMIPIGAGGAMGSAAGRHTYFGLYEGGIFQLGSGFGWFLPNGGKHPNARLERDVAIARAVWGLPSGELVRKYRSDPTDFDDFVRKPLTDPYWRTLGYVADDDRFATPALVFNTWQDQTVADTLALAEVMKRNADTPEAREHHHVVIGPGNHCQHFGKNERMKVGELELGPNARAPIDDWQVAWFDHWLKGEGKLPSLPPYRFYVMGEDRWIDSSQWPAAEVKYEPWYLDGTGPANSRKGHGTLARQVPASTDASDAFIYDPTNPVPTRGGPMCCTNDPAQVQGPADQAVVEQRDDVLVYTSAVLTEPLRIAGPVRAELFVSSDAPDTDFTAKLVDVAPDGRALSMQEGALRMRYRGGYASPRLMSPGVIYRATIDMRAIAWYLPAGHRLRLQISSSNFPRLERNLNTGGNNYDEAKPRVARNRVIRNASSPSAIILPILPDPAH